MRFELWGSASGGGRRSFVRVVYLGLPLWLGEGATVVPLRGGEEAKRQGEGSGVGGSAAPLEFCAVPLGRFLLRLRASSVLPAPAARGDGEDGSRRAARL